MDKVTLRVGDFIAYNTNPRLEDYFGFIKTIKSNGDIELIKMFNGNTKPEDKEYLFNNPEEWCGCYIRGEHVRRKIK